MSSKSGLALAGVGALALGAATPGEHWSSGKTFVYDEKPSPFSTPVVSPSGFCI